MKPASIVRFEILYNAQKAYTYIFFGLLVFQGVWFSMGANNLVANNNILLNAPAINYKLLACMGMLLFAVTAIISAGALARDLESGAAHILYPGIIHEKRYFCGKYIGVVLVNLAVVLGYPLGILLFPFLGTGAPEQFGPAPLGQLVHGFFLLTMPNMVFLITFSVFLVVMFRKAAAAYIGVLLILICFLIAVSVQSESSLILIVELLDPFGYCSVKHITDKMDMLEFNTAYLPVSTELLWNRMIWGAVSIFLFGVSFLKFKFKHFVAQTAKKPRRQKEPVCPAQEKPFQKNRSNAVPVPEYGPRSCLVKSVEFAWLEMKSLFRSPIFSFIMITLFLMFLGYNFLWTSAQYLTTSHLPLTSVMTYARIPMMIVIAMMLLILSGELLFKDRSSGVWQLIDAMPTPSWVFVLSRWLTMGIVAFCIASLIFAAGILSQLAMGFTDIEWHLYIRDLYGSKSGWLTFLQIISLAFFCGALFNSRLKGHIFSIGVFLFIAMSVDHKLIEQLRFGFPFVPGVFGPERYNYSQMNGYGVLDAGLFWYSGAWTALAALFFVLTLLLWNRGVDRSLKERWQVMKRTLCESRGKGLAGAMVLCLFLFGCFQYGIHDNLIRKAGYQTEAQKEAAAAAYEKKYVRYRETPWPKITDLDLNLDLFPAKRQANCTARLVLQNKTDRPMDTLHLDRAQKLTVAELYCDGHTLEKLEDDSEFRHAIYRLQPALAPGNTMGLNIKATLAYKGFHQSDFQGDLTYNGSVLGTDFLPFFGYDRSRELDENKKRLRQGLDLLDSRMDRADNLFSGANRFESVQADSLTWNMVISTDGDQTVIGPGEEVNTWQEKGRNYSRFRSEHPGSMDFKIISARLVTRAFDCQGVPCRLSHDPRHTYNLQVVEDAMQKAVSWLSGKLGHYPYSVAQVVEKPFYDTDFITFANVTAISEACGWTADIQEDEDGQYVYLTMARELAGQWILASLKAADVQGAELLTQSIAQYYAFRFMDETWGHGQTGKWLDKAYKDYEKDRAEEAIEEKPLLFVDKATYLSREKGGLALYALSRRMGPETFDQWLGKWIVRACQKETFLTSADFYNDLKNFVPAGLHPFVRDWFEMRIQYRLSLDNAQIKDGKLALTISAAKMESGDEKGRMKKSFSVPLNVGMADESGNVKNVSQIIIRPGQNSYVLDCHLSSATIVLDPYYWYLIEARKKCLKKL
jgi:ABC-type transport system involved in multi-copper enzyme maturation permease subunit